MECSWKTRACLAPDAEKAFERQKRAGLAIVKTLCRIRRGSDQAFLGQEAEAKRLGHPADCQTDSFLTVGREKGSRRLRSRQAAPIGQGCGTSRECGVGRKCGAIQAGVLARRGCGRAGGAGEPGVRAGRAGVAGRAGGAGKPGVLASRRVLASRGAGEPEGAGKPGCGRAGGCGPGEPGGGASPAEARASRRCGPGGPGVAGRAGMRTSRKTGPSRRALPPGLGSGMRTMRGRFALRAARARVSRVERARLLEGLAAGLGRHEHRQHQA